MSPAVQYIQGQIQAGAVPPEAAPQIIDYATQYDAYGPGVVATFPSGPPLYLFNNLMQGFQPPPMMASAPMMPSGALQGVPSPVTPMTTPGVFEAAMGRSTPLMGPARSPPNQPSSMSNKAARVAAARAPQGVPGPAGPLANQSLATVRAPQSIPRAQVRVNPFADVEQFARQQPEPTMLMHWRTEYSQSIPENDILSREIELTPPPLAPGRSCGAGDQDCQESALNPQFDVRYDVLADAGGGPPPNPDDIEARIIHTIGKGPWGDPAVIKCRCELLKWLLSLLSKNDSRYASLALKVANYCKEAERVWAAQVAPQAQTEEIFIETPFGKIRLRVGVHRLDPGTFGVVGEGVFPGLVPTGCRLRVKQCTSKDLTIDGKSGSLSFAGKPKRVFSPPAVNSGLHLDQSVDYPGFGNCGGSDFYYVDAPGIPGIQNTPFHLMTDSAGASLVGKTIVLKLTLWAVFILICPNKADELLGVMRIVIITTIVVGEDGSTVTTGIGRSEDAPAFLDAGFARRVDSLCK